MPVYYLHIRRTIICGLIGLGLALVIGLLSPKIYEGRMQILVGANQTIRPTNSLLYPEVQDILDAATAKDTLSELDVLRGEGVFTEALSHIYKNKGKQLKKEDRDRFYAMYDVVSAKETSVGEVRARADDPQVAADLANEIGIVYNDLRKRSSQVAVQDSIVMLERMVKDSHDALEKAHKSMEEYKTKTGMMDVGTGYTQKSNELSSLQLQYDAAQADLAGANAEVAANQDQLSRVSPKQEVATTDARNPVVQQSEQQLTDLLARRDTLAATYTDASPQVKEVDEQIANAKNRLKAQKQQYIKAQMTVGDNPLYLQLKQSLAVALARRDNLTQRVNQLKQQVDSRQNFIGIYPAFEAESKRLSTEEQIADTKYRRVKDQYDSLKLKTEAPARAAQILYLATPDEEPVAPVFGKMAIIGLLAGLMLGLLYSYALEALKLRVYNSSHLSELTGLPVAASIPALPRPQVRRLQRSFDTDNPVVLEPFRFMAFSTLSGAKEKHKSVLFTGVGGTVGTTTSAAQYAIAAARTGLKVILVDYDLQYGTLTRLFGMTEKTGLRDILSNSVPSEASVIVASKEPRLGIVPVGSEVNVQATDIPFGNLEALIKLLESQADLVVIDSPAVDQVSDAGRMAACVEQVCLVVSATATNYRQILTAQDILKRSGAKDVVMILSGGNPQDEPFAAQLSALKSSGA